MRLPLARTYGTLLAEGGKPPMCDLVFSSVPADAYHRIPEVAMESLVRWVHFGIPTGSFLQAVLRNDLMEASGRADHINITLLHVYASLLYNYLPGGCWGGRVGVEVWGKHRAEVGPLPASNVQWPPCFAPVVIRAFADLARDISLPEESDV